MRSLGALLLGKGLERGFREGQIGICHVDTNVGFAGLKSQSQSSRPTSELN